MGGRDFFGGAIVSERSADILMALSPYRASDSRRGGAAARATPLLATAVADAREAPPADPRVDVAVKSDEPAEEPDAYMAPPLRVHVTTFDGPPGR